MINMLSLTLQLSNLLLLHFFSICKHTSMSSRAIFFKISLKNSKLKTTHKTLRDCHIHFFQQPFSKYRQRYINTWRACQTQVDHSQIFDWKRFARHKSLCGNKIQSTNLSISFPMQTRNQRQAYHWQNDRWLQNFVTI